MSIYQIIILGAAGIAALFSFKLPKAFFWIAAIAGIYLLTNWYWESGFPQPVAFAALCDAALAGEILRSTHHKKERWQLCAALIVQTMFLVNIAYFATQNLLSVTLLYQSSLEILNITAFVVIGGTAVSNLLGQYASDTFSHTMRDLYAFMRDSMPQSTAIKGR